MKTLVNIKAEVVSDSLDGTLVEVQLKTLTKYWPMSRKRPYSMHLQTGQQRWSAT